MRLFSKRLEGMGADYRYDAKVAEWLANRIRGAVHFSLPDGGRILGDGLKGIAGSEIHLPYPEITIEYFVSEEPKEIEDTETVHSPRRVAWAAEMATDAAHAWLRQMHPHWRGRVDTFAGMCDSVICVATVFEHNGMWLPASMSLMLPTRGWDQEGEGVIEPLRPRMTGNRMQMTPQVLFPSMYGPMVKKYGIDLALRYGVNDVSAEASALLEMIEALTCSNVGITTAQTANAAVNERRVRSGKLPIYETKVLTIETPKTTRSATTIGCGDRSSPRQHLRRGHIRELGSGKRIWVTSCVVGSAGFVHKRYRVAPPRQAAGAAA